MPRDLIKSSRIACGSSTRERSSSLGSFSGSRRAVALNAGRAREGRRWRAAAHRRYSLLPLGAEAAISSNSLSPSRSRILLTRSGIRDQRLVEQRLDEVVSARIVPALLVEGVRKAGHGGTIVDRRLCQLIEQAR